MAQVAGMILQSLLCSVSGQQDQPGGMEHPCISRKPMDLLPLLVWVLVVCPGTLLITFRPNSHTANNQPLTIIHKESTFGRRLLRDVVPNHTRGIYINNVSYARPMAQYGEQLKYGLCAAGAASLLLAPIAAPYMVAAYIGSWGIPAVVGSQVVTAGFGLYTGTQGVRIMQDGLGKHLDPANQRDSATLHERDFMVLDFSGDNAVPLFFSEAFEVNWVAQGRIG